jgi:hypothetical protein
MSAFYELQAQYLETNKGQKFIHALNAQSDSTSTAVLPDQFEVGYLCDNTDCPEGFKTERESFYHSMNEHPNKKKLICPFINCMKSYVKQRSLANHIDREHPNKPFECYFCSNGTTYKNFNEFKIHLRKEHISR